MTESRSWLPTRAREGVGVIVAAWGMATAALIGFAAWVCIVAGAVEAGAGIGALLLPVGVVTLVAGIASRFRLATAIGIAQSMVVLFFVALVNALSWSPSDARLPFAILGVAHLAAVGSLTVIAWRTRPTRYEPWQCGTCGYPLYGLDAACCPECGTAFDATTVAAAIDDAGLRPRVAPGSGPDHRRAVFASVAVVEDARVLLVREAKPDVRGCWNLPGGRLERGETPRVAARRELREETGLEASVEGVVGVYAGADWIRFVFRASRDGADPVAGDEIEAVEWVPVDQLAGVQPRDALALDAIFRDVARGTCHDLEIVEADPAPTP